MERILIFGANGMAAHVISAKLKSEKYQVYETFRQEKFIIDNNFQFKLDVTDIKKVDEILEKVNPEIIINCVGLLNHYAENRPDLAILINAYFPRYLEQKFKNTKVKIIHLSTDCVFSGKEGNRNETSLKDGDTVYDQTKSLGEIVNEKDLTFRMSIIGPDSDKHGIGLFNWFMKQSGDINGYTNAFWTGVTTIELAKAISSAIKLNLTGLYHLVPKEKISKYQLLELFNESFKKNIKINPYRNFYSDKSLICTRSDFNYAIPSYKDMVNEMKIWVDNNKDLYRHYFN